MKPLSKELNWHLQLDHNHPATLCWKLLERLHGAFLLSQQVNVWPGDGHCSQWQTHNKIFKTARGQSCSRWGNWAWVCHRGQGGRTVNHSSLAPEPLPTPMSHRAQCHRPAQDGRQAEVTPELGWGHAWAGKGTLHRKRHAEFSRARDPGARRRDLGPGQAPVDAGRWPPQDSREGAPGRQPGKLSGLGKAPQVRQDWPGSREPAPLDCSEQWGEQDALWAAVILPLGVLSVGYAKDNLSEHDYCQALSPISGLSLRQTSDDLGQIDSPPSQPGMGYSRHFIIASPQGIKWLLAP